MLKRILRPFQSIHFKIPVLFILMLIMALQLISANFIRQLENQTIDNIESQLQLRYDFLKTGVAQIMNSNASKAKKESDIYQLLQDSGNQSNIEINVINRDGYILGTNDQTKQNLVGTKTTDQQVQKAVALGKYSATQYIDNHTNERQMRIIGPIAGDESDIAGTMLLIDSNIEDQYDQVREITGIFFNSSLIALAITVVVSFLTSRGLTRPISEMVDQTERISEGDYSSALRIYSDDEIGQLGKAINLLAIKIRDAQESTEAERQRLDSVLHHMTDGVIATDRRGRVLIINDAALDMLNAEETSVIGRDILTVLNLKDKTSFHALLTGNEQETVTIDNSILQCDFSIIQRETGFISGVVCVVADITEQEKIENERRNFVSNVSHELRTPLTSIKSYTEALVDGAWKDEKVAPEFLQVIQTEAQRMIRMINDLLNLSRMDQKRLELDKEFVNLNGLFNHILNRFDLILKDDQYKEHPFTLKREITQTELWIELDQDKFTQVIDNLMNNAIKYSPNGGEIKASLIETHDKIVISIQDQGMGIARRAIPKVFNRFYRVDKARSRAMGGTGLGLAIAKEVIDLSGGRIWVESEENVGSTFYIELPYEPFDESEEFN